MIAMRIDDTVGADLDPALRGLVVVFNASAQPVTLARAWSLPLRP